MNPEPDPELLLLYVAGACDHEESARAEAMLCAGRPCDQAAIAEAVAVFHSVALGLSPVSPPDAVRQSILTRVTADCVPVVSTMSIGRNSSASNYASRFRWPVYVSSGLAACLAVALSMSLWNYRQAEGQMHELAAGNQELNDENSKMTATLAASESVLRSPHVTLARMQTQDTSANQYGRVLFCPVSHQYQVVVFNLKPLPAGKAYELWLITPDQHPVPAGMFVVDNDGTAMITAHPRQPVQLVANAAVTAEPASGSDAPTGAIQLLGTLNAQ